MVKNARPENFELINARRLWLGDVFSVDDGKTWHELATNTTELGFVTCFRPSRPGYGRARTYRMDLAGDLTVRRAR